jgi:hypothetical protein
VVLLKNEVVIEIAQAAMPQNAPTANVTYDERGNIVQDGITGYVSKDNDPSPRDSQVDYVGLDGVGLQDTPNTKPYIDAHDDEVIGFVDEEELKKPSHEFGTPENPGGYHTAHTFMHEVGYSDDPAFKDEPFLLKPFEYNSVPNVNRPDFTPRVEVVEHKKRRAPGTPFKLQYRYTPPEIGGPEEGSHYGYSYFQNKYD